MIKFIQFETTNGNGEAIRQEGDLWEINAPGGMTRFHGTPGEVQKEISKIVKAEKELEES